MLALRLTLTLYGLRKRLFLDTRNVSRLRYAEGNGIHKQDAKAVEWLLSAAEQGNADAQYMLGQWIEIGRGIERNLANAAKWYRLAAAQGHNEAQSKLTEMASAEILPSDYALLCESKQGFLTNCAGHPISWTGTIVKSSRKEMRVEVDGTE